MNFELRIQMRCRKVLISEGKLFKNLVNIVEFFSDL